ncbi:MAG: hypothetical protein ACTSU5_00615 [Promethearchaeota archaeon]
MGSPDEISSGSRIVFTTCAEVREIATKHTTLCAPSRKKGSYERMFRAYQLITNQIDRIGVCVVGVDPGLKHTGVAVFADETFIEGKTVQLAELGEFFSGIFRFYTPGRFLVKFGGGQPSYLKWVLRAISSAGTRDDVYFQRVDEESTTKRSVAFLGELQGNFGPDTLAAIHIALKDSTEVEIPLAALKDLLAREGGGSSFTRGEVKSIQQMSREVSGGSITISSRLARRVLDGELSLREAVERQKKRDQR